MSSCLRNVVHDDEGALLGLNEALHPPRTVLYTVDRSIHASARDGVELFPVHAVQGYNVSVSTQSISIGDSHSITSHDRTLHR